MQEKKGLVKMKKITPERLKNIALFYLERYEASTDKLRTILKRRLMKAKLEQPIPPEAFQWVETIIHEMQRLGYIDDKRFSENLVRRLSQAGKSPVFIKMKLKLAGIDEELITDLLSETDALEQARLMIQKKHLGHDFKHDLSCLARMGFSYEIAREALEENSFPSEENF